MNRTRIERTLRPVAAGSLLLVILIAVLGSAVRDPRPHEISVVISAPAPVVEQLAQAFGQAAPGALSLKPATSGTDARALVDQRDAVAALIVDSTGTRLVVAGAAGDAVTGAVTAAFNSAFQVQGTQLAVEVVHPFPTGDPHGIVLFFLVLATLIASVVAGAIAVLPGRDGAQMGSWTSQLGAIAAYAVVAGVLGVLVANWLADGLGDGAWLAMGIVALLALAIGSVVVASARLLGAAGVALAALVVVLLGIISSGGPLGSSFLPDGYRALTPWLPVGPAYDALRGALAFDAVGVVGSLVALAAWAAAGIAVAGVHGALGRPGRPAAVASASAHPVP